MNDLATALLLWLALTATPARADSRQPLSIAASRFSDNPSHARRAQQYGSFSNHTLANSTVANHTLSNNDSTITSSSSSSSSSDIPAHSLYTSSSSAVDSFSASTYELPAHSTSSSSATSTAPSMRLISTPSLQPNTTVDASHNSTLSDTLHVAGSQSEPRVQPSERPPQHSSTGNITSSRPYPLSLDSLESPSPARLSALVTANSSAPWHQSSMLSTAATSAIPAASLYTSKLANATTSASTPSYTGLANDTRENLDLQSLGIDNSATAKPTGPRPTCHPSYIAALNNGLEGALNANVSDELCDACPRTADVLKYQSEPAPGGGQTGHDYAVSCNMAWLQYSKHSSLWWGLVGSKSTSHHSMSTGSTSRVLGRVANPTVLADGFTRMKGASRDPGAWVPIMTEEVPTETLPPPATSTAYHKACLDPKMRASQNFRTRFPNRKPHCDIGPAQCQYLNHKHASASDNDDDRGAQAPICGNRSFNYSTCNIFASKVQIFYWPDATDVHKSHALTTPAPSTKPRSAVVGGHTMISPYVYLSLQHLGIDKTWILDLTSRSTSKGLPDATNTLLQLAPELLSTVVYTVPGCKGLCADHLQSMFSTPPSGDPKRRLHFTAQPYNPATVNHSEPVPASAYFWGRVAAGHNLGRVPLPELYYHPKQQIIWDDYLPQIAVPDDIRKLGPNGTWEGCGLGIGGIYDPPYALEAGSTVAAPDITPPGGVQPTSTPALPGNGNPQAPVPTAFGGPAMPAPTPPPGVPANSQPSPPAPSEPAENAFGNPTAPGAPSAVPPSHEGIPLAPTSFGQSVSISPNSADSSVSSEPSSTIPAAPAPQISTPMNSNSLAAQPVNSPNGLVAVAFNPNGDPNTPGASTGMSTPSITGSENPVADSDGLPDSSSGGIPSVPDSRASSQSLPSVVEGAIISVPLPQAVIPSTSMPAEPDAVAYATSPVRPDFAAGLYQPGTTWTGASDVLNGGAGTGAGAGAVGASSNSPDQDFAALFAFDEPTSSATTQDLPSSPAIVPSQSSTGTNAFATHTLIRNIFGDVVATAALVADQTIVAGGPAATIDGNTVSLSPEGGALVLNGATTTSFAMTTGQTSRANVNSATAYRAMVTGADSGMTTGVALYGTTLTAGGPSLVYASHTYSAGPSGNVVIDGSRTVQVQVLSSTSSPTSVPSDAGTPTKSTGTITTAAIKIGSTENLCATETALTDLGGATHNVVYIGSQTASVGQTITMDGTAVTVASTGLIYNGSTARFNTTTVGLSSPTSPTTVSATGSSIALNPFQAGNMPGTNVGASRTQSSSSSAPANAATSTSSRHYRLLGAVGSAIVSLSLLML